MFSVYTGILLITSFNKVTTEIDLIEKKKKVIK